MTNHNIASQIDYWASLINEKIEEEKKYEEACNKYLEQEKNGEVDEATEMFKVDNQYVAKAKAALSSLKTSDPYAYEMAMTYLERHNGQNLVMSPEDFAKRRIELAGQKDEEPVDSRTTDQRREDAMKAAASTWDDVSKDEKQPADQPIKSIWVKARSNDVFTLVLTYTDGKTEEVKEDLTISEGDKYYKEIKQALRAARIANKDDRPVSKIDVQLSILRVSFQDPAIKWFYGKSKKAENVWADAKEVKKQTKAKESPISKGFEAWQSEYGSKTKIYQTQEDEEKTSDDEENC